MMAIKQRLAIPARVTLTAYGFLQFAVQVLWLGKWQMPRVLERYKDNPDARREALRISHRHVLRYLATLEWLRLVEFRFEGTPHEQPCIMVANHPSLLDFIVLLRDLPNGVCLYKSSSLNNPVLSSFVQAAGYIEGMEGPATTGAGKRIIATCCKRLAQGHHVVFFPEGTRSGSASMMHRFRSTAFHAALRCPAAIQPVVILCQPLMLGKGQRWIDFSRRRNIMTVRYLPVMQVDDLPADEQSASGLARAVRGEIASALAAVRPGGAHALR